MINHSNFTDNLRGRSTKDSYTRWPISGLGQVTWPNLSFYIPLIIFATVDGRIFKFYTQLTTEKYNNTYIREPVNSRVVEFCIVLTNVTNLHDHFYLYSLNVHLNCYMRHWTDTVFIRTLSCYLTKIRQKVVGILFLTHSISELDSVDCMVYLLKNIRYITVITLQ